MQVKTGRDFWAALMFMGVGLGFVIVAQNYAMGSAVRMGPAYFPTILGGLQFVLGAVIFIRSFASHIVHSMHVFAFRPLVLAVGVALAVITYFVGGTGLLHQILVALTLMAIVAAFGPRALFIILSGVIVFAFLLKPLGLILATLVLTFVSAYGGTDFRLKEVVILYIVLIIGSSVVFVKALGLPFNLCPAAFEDACRAIGL